MNVSKNKSIAPPVRLNAIRVAALGLLTLSFALAVTGIMLRRQATLVAAEPPPPLAAPPGRPAAVAIAPERPAGPPAKAAPAVPTKPSAVSVDIGYLDHPEPPYNVSVDRVIYE
jgi:hypothetical protein